jgi:hypothetical protein
MIDIAALTLNALQAAGVNAYAELPENSTRPVLRIQEIGVDGPSSHMPDWLHEFDLQVDSWGESKGDAHGLLEAAASVLRGHPSNQHGQITRFQVVSLDYQPDEDWPANGRPGPRYLSILRLFAHP